MQSSGMALDERPLVAHTPDTSTEASAPPVPRTLLWVSSAVVIAGVAMAVVGAQRAGISWDEPYHVMRLRNYLEHGWFAVDWSVASAGTGEGESNTLVYGPATMLLLHVLAVLVGAETWGTVATTPEAYVVRHLGVVAIGLAGTAAAAATTRILLGSWRWGLVTAAALLALPMWTGHLMVNVKDVPVAAGYSVMTLALVAMVGASPRRRALRVLGLACGIVLMVGTRPAMATAVVLALVVLGAGLVVRGRVRDVRATVVEVVAGVGIPAVVLVAAYPQVFAHPLLLWHSAVQSASFREGADPNYLHIPFHLAAQFPVLLQACAAIGLGSAVVVSRRRWRVEPERTTQLVLVLVQATALPLVAIAKNSDLYNGLRQLLFACPAWAVLVTLGVAQVIAWSRTHGRHRVASGLAAVALVVPVVDQATLFPYQYSYWNPALDAWGTHVQSDYWRTSVPELLPDVPTDGQIICGPTRSSQLGDPAGSDGADGVTEKEMLAGRFSSDSTVDCRIDPLGPLAPLWAADELPLDDALPHDEFYVIIDRDHAVPQNCSVLAAVTRIRHWREVSMTYVAHCRLEPPLLEDTVAFTRLPTENMSPLLWTYAPRGWVMRESSSAIDATGTSSSLTFAVPDECGRSACSLLLDADAPQDLTASVNDVPVAADVRVGQVAVPLAQGPPDTWVTFTRSSGEPLGLRVRTIRLVPTGTVQEELR